MKRRRFLKLSLGGLIAGIIAPLVPYVKKPLEPVEVTSGLGQMPIKAEGQPVYMNPEDWRYIYGSYAEAGELIRDSINNGLYETYRKMK